MYRSFQVQMFSVWLPFSKMAVVGHFKILFSPNDDNRRATKKTLIIESI